MIINYQEEQMVIGEITDNEMPLVLAALQDTGAEMCQELDYEQDDEINEVSLYVGDYLEYMGVRRIFNRYCQI